MATVTEEVATPINNLDRRSDWNLSQLMGFEVARLIAESQFYFGVIRYDAPQTSRLFDTLDKVFHYLHPLMAIDKSVALKNRIYDLRADTALELEELSRRSRTNPNIKYVISNPTYQKIDLLILDIMENLYSRNLGISSQVKKAPLTKKESIHQSFKRFE